MRLHGLPLSLSCRCGIASGSCCGAPTRHACHSLGAVSPKAARGVRSSASVLFRQHCPNSCYSCVHATTAPAAVILETPPLLIYPSLALLCSSRSRIFLLQNCLRRPCVTTFFTRGNVVSFLATTIILFYLPNGRDIKNTKLEFCTGFHTNTKGGASV